MADSYRSTVVAPAQILLGILSGVLIAVILIALDSGLWPVAVLALLGASALGFYLATLTVNVDHRHLGISQGRGDKTERLISVDEITAIETHTLTWQQAFGIGIASDDLTTRLTVRPGPALFVSVISGEQVRVSVTDPDAAIAALGRPSLVAPPTVAPPTVAPPTVAPEPDYLLAPPPEVTPPVMTPPPVGSAATEQDAPVPLAETPAEPTTVLPAPGIGTPAPDQPRRRPRPPSAR